MRKKVNLNTSALFVQTIALILMLIAIFLPSWLANPAGLSYYPNSRSWGLLSVTGRTTRSHTAQWTMMCKISAQLSYGVVCTSPLCSWYAQKCSAYRIVLIISSTTLGLLCIACILCVASMVFSFRKARKALAFASGMGFVSVIFSVSAITAYIFTMGEAFATINSAGYYPVPQPSVSLILASVSTFLLFLGTILHFCRLRTIRREADFIQETKYDQQRAKGQLGI